MWLELVAFLILACVVGFPIMAYFEVDKKVVKWCEKMMEE